MSLATVRQEYSYPDRAYFGDRDEWFIVVSQNRDSDALSRSNFRSVRQALESIDLEGVAVESASHWLVGWVEYLLVSPSSPALARANEIRSQLDDYPVFDEEDWSNEEFADSVAICQMYAHDTYRWLTIDHDRLGECIAQAYSESGRFDSEHYPDPDRSDERQILATALRAYRRERLT